MSKRPTFNYRFGPFFLDAGERLLLCEGEPVPLAPKVFDTLVTLVDNCGQLLDKGELMSRLWPDTFVEEGTLARNVADLRKALGEASPGHTYIATVPKRGYRFVAAVKLVRPDDSSVVLERRIKTRTVVEEQTDEDGALASIAILPFRPISGEVRDEYLELGIADALITRLSNINQIVVRPTSSVRKYVDVTEESIVAGRELRVSHVLEGSIQRAGLVRREPPASSQAIFSTDVFDNHG